MNTMKRITSPMSMQHKQQGIAVITVILIVALLTTLMAYAVETQHMLVRRVTNQNMLEQSYQLALGGEQWIAVVLKQDAENEVTRNSDHFNEDWNSLEENVSLDVGEVQVKVLDQSGLLNLNALANYPDDPENVDPQFAGAVWILNNLLILLEIDNGLVGNLVDWVDNNNSDLPAQIKNDSGQRPLYKGGAEDNHYTGLDRPYRAANQQLSSIGELKYIKGFDQKVIKKLTPYVTVLPTTRLQINLYTAPKMLLQAMSNAPGGEPDNLADVLALQEQPIEESESQGIKNQINASWMPMAADVVTAKSEFFTVTTEAKFGDLRYSMRSILHRSFDPDERQAGKVKPVKVVKRERILL